MKVLYNFTLFNIGNTHIVVTLINEENENILTEESNNQKPNSNYILNLKIFSEDYDYDPLNFQPSKSKIRIGRSSDCEVFINDSLISRYQCIIEYDNTVGWTIRDGYTVKNLNGATEYKSSTNGTWYVLFK